jgi:hypothetical protein
VKAKLLSAPWLGYGDRGFYMSREKHPKPIQSLSHPVVSLTIKAAPQEDWFRASNVPVFPVRLGMTFQPSKRQPVEGLDHAIATVAWMIDNVPGSYFLTEDGGGETAVYFYSIEGDTVLVNKEHRWVGGDGSDRTKALADLPWRWGDPNA